MPVLVTKLHAPAQRERMVQRPRLDGSLDALLEPGQRLGLISAPAGFGKTTLLGHWTSSVVADPSRGGVAAAWISLDERDNDLDRLMAHVLAALHRADAPVEGASLGAVGAGGLDVSTATSVLDVVVNAIAESQDVRRDAGTDARRRWLLVLDDYHVITATDVHETLTYLVEHLPEQLRVADLDSVRSPDAFGPSPQPRPADRGPGSRDAIHSRRGRRLLATT